MKAMENQHAYCILTSQWTGEDAPTEFILLQLCCLLPESDEFQNLNVACTHACKLKIS